MNRREKNLENKTHDKSANTNARKKKQPETKEMGWMR